MKGIEASTELLVRSETFCKEKKRLHEWVAKEKYRYSRPHEARSLGLQLEGVTLMTDCLMLKLSSHTDSSAEMEKLVGTGDWLDST